MKNSTYISLFFTLFLLLGCEKETSFDQEPFVIAFEKQSVDFSSIEDSYEVKLVFSEPSQTSGTVKIKLTEDNAVYGIDYNTIPAFQNNILEIPFEAGALSATITFNNLIYPFDRSDKIVQFEIESIQTGQISNIQGYATCVISFNRSVGATLSPNTGGPNQPNSVFVDLSTGRMTEIRRDSWDLGFYSGDAFRVTLNGSIYMAAAQLATTDMASVTTATVVHLFDKVKIGTFDPANENYIDAPNGAITQTAIAEISADDAENKVYLLNLGYKIGTAVPQPGSVAVAGDPRGWLKIRILRKGEGYELHYAELDETTFKTVEIAKTPTHNFTHFSFSTNQTVQIEPAKDKWDLEFTVFTNINEGAGSYGFTDFVTVNLKGNVQAYEITANQDMTYEKFAESHIDENLFSNDQRVIGASWRDVFTGRVDDKKFYLLKDADGNYYKIRMLAFTSPSGERGYPKFEYQLVK